MDFSTWKVPACVKRLSLRASLELTFKMRFGAARQGSSPDQAPTRGPHMMTRMFKTWLVALPTVALFTSVSTMWLDRPIAFLVRDIFGEQRISLDLTHTPILSVPLISASIFVVFGLAAMMGRRFSKVETAVLLCDISILAVTA